MGLALYGSAPYKHLFREAEPALRARLHDAILGAGLDLDGCGEAHEWVIEPFIPPYLSETWAMCKRQRLKYV
jgi:hypothetical protein